MIEKDPINIGTVRARHKYMHLVGKCTETENQPKGRKEQLWFSLENS
jgi:hypothetical protein